MKNVLAIIAIILSFNVAAYEERIGSVTGTTAQTLVVGAADTICIYCTTGSIRYTVGNATTIQTATTTNGAVVDFPGDCYRIPMGRGNDRISVIHKDGSSSFTCEVNRVLK